jgi:hypothetical protein
MFLVIDFGLRLVFNERSEPKRLTSFDHKCKDINIFSYIREKQII